MTQFKPDLNILKTSLLGNWFWESSLPQVPRPRHVTMERSQEIERKKGHMSIEKDGGKQIDFLYRFHGPGYSITAAETSTKNIRLTSNVCCPHFGWRMSMEILEE